MLHFELETALLKDRRGIISSSERGLPSWFKKLLTDANVINMPIHKATENLIISFS